MRKERELERIIADKDRTIVEQQRVIRQGALGAGDHIMYMRYVAVSCCGELTMATPLAPPPPLQTAPPRPWPP